MSFRHTTEQVRNRTKTVTRRLRWETLKPGTLLQPVVQRMGLRKGQPVERIGGPIRVVRVTREYLDDLIRYPDDAPDEVAREGYPGMSAEAFVEMFTKHNKCAPWARVTRIEFEYVDP